MVYENPQDGLQAKFSLNFAVAVAIVDGDAGLKQFTTARLRDAKVKRIMERVELVGLPTQKKKQAMGIRTEVEIRMRGGVIHRGHAAVARGHPALPASRAEIEAKFRQCADAILPAQTITKIPERLLDARSRPVGGRVAPSASSAPPLTFSGRAR